MFKVFTHKLKNHLSFIIFWIKVSTVIYRNTIQLIKKNLHKQLKGKKKLHKIVKISLNLKKKNL